jgi:hypothetical protein
MVTLMLAQDFDGSTLRVQCTDHHIDLNAGLSNT